MEAELSVQDKKLKSESRYETLKLLASLAPSTSSSANLLSSSSLGQSPMNPVSAREREEKREDKLVRRGIERLEKRNGPLGAASGDDSESDSEGVKSGRKVKSKAVETVHEVGNGKLVDAVDVGAPSGTKRKRNKSSKKVRISSYPSNRRDRLYHRSQGLIYRSTGILTCSKPNHQILPTLTRPTPRTIHPLPKSL